jgi:hypothetical protein
MSIALIFVIAGLLLWTLANGKASLFGAMLLVAGLIAYAMGAAHVPGLR